MHARVDRRGVLTFPALFPRVTGVPAMVAELKGMVASRSARTQPDHKRLDARRARLSAAVRKGDFSLAVHIRGANHDYAVKKALNLVNEMFVALHEGHPQYLVEHFNLSSE